MNRLPSGGDCEEETGVSSPNSTVSSVSGKRSERDVTCEDIEMERDGCRGISDEEDAETSRKKLRLTKDQSIILEESFKEHNTLNPVSIIILFFIFIFLPNYYFSYLIHFLAETKVGTSKTIGS